MQSTAKTPDDYIAELPADRKEAIIKLRKEVLKNLPKGFKEVMGYGMMGYVVPIPFILRVIRFKKPEKIPLNCLVS